eukprot:m51a1_g1332 hypothetical protein (1034) ;mRNA; f:293554-298842
MVVCPLALKLHVVVAALASTAVGWTTSPGGTLMDEGWPAVESNISTLLTSSTAILGAGGSFGAVVCGIGDTDGDSHADLAVSAPKVATYEYGRLYVVFGPNASAAGQTLAIASLVDGTRGYALRTSTDSSYAWSHFALSLSPVGDMNNDSLPDWAAGTTDWKGSGTGKAWIVYGTRTRPSAIERDIETVRAWIMQGDSIWQGVGPVAGLGDINGDSYPDVVVGWPGWTYGISRGKVGVVFGSSTGPSKEAWFEQIYNLDHNGWGTGRFVSAAGDVDGDGFRDFLVGADGAWGSSGTAYLVWGHADPWEYNVNKAVVLPGTGNLQFGYEQPSSKVGAAIVSAGDFNGDSLDDFVIAAPAYTVANVTSGRVYLVFGAANRTVWGAGDSLVNLGKRIGGVKFDGPATGQAGTALAGGFDWNGDSLPDIAIGAPLADGNKGRVYIIFGRKAAWPSVVVRLDSLQATDGHVLHGDVANGLFGSAVSAAGDFNGDNVDDLVIGAPGGNGAAYVAYGYRLPRMNRSIASQAGCCTARMTRAFSFTWAPDSFARATSPPVTYSVTPAVSWATFDAATHTFSGTPTGDEVGHPLNITVTAVDAKGFWAQQRFQVNVFRFLDVFPTPFNFTEDAPPIAVPVAVDTPNSTTLSFAVALSDPRAGTLAAATAGSTSSHFDAASGVWTASGPTADVRALLLGLRFEPGPNFDRDFNVTVHGTDMWGTAADAGFGVAVTAVDDPPVVVFANFTVVEGGTLVINQSMIYIYDVDTAPQDITIRVASVRHGAFTKDGVPVSVGGRRAFTSFTQQDIDDGRISFTHDGGETAPSFTLEAADKTSVVQVQSSGMLLQNVDDPPGLGESDIVLREMQPCAVLVLNVTDPDTVLFPDNVTVTLANMSGVTFIDTTKGNATTTVFNLTHAMTGAISVCVDAGREDRPAFDIQCKDHFNLYGEDEVLLEPSSEFEVVQVIPIFTDLVCKVVMREVIPSSPLIPLEARPIVLIPPEMPKHQLSGKLKIALKKVVDPSLSSSSDSIVSPKEVHDNSQ